MALKERTFIIMKVITVEMFLGTKYYDKDKNLLKTPKEVLQHLFENDEIIVEPTEERKVIYNIISNNLNLN